MDRLLNFANNFYKKSQEKLTTKQLSSHLSTGDRKIIISQDPIYEFKNINQIPGSKPNGLWYAISNKWIEFEISCGDDEDPNVDIYHNYAYELMINKSSMKLISSLEELIRFDKQYGYNTYDKNPLWNNFINWNKVSQNYSGVEINPYISYSDKRPHWYNGYDIPSGCIWNKSAFQSLKLIAEKDETSHWKLVK